MADEFAKDMLRVFNISQMQSSEHRTIAIVTAAYIDDYLTVLIKKKMPGLNSALATRLFGDRGSISTLASKIDIARALGAIPPAQAKENRRYQAPAAGDGRATKI